MAQIGRQGLWQLGLVGALAIGGAIAASGNSASAQIVTDGTLGSESTVVRPNAGNVDTILGGATRGANLFHSFEQFSVLTGRTAFFNNGPNIQNIISRVTGGSISNIDGLIRANGTANVFLINPNGIIFGPNASLNIGGSFLASTASAVNFADGNFFSATAPQSAPLLEVNVPLGLQYGSNSGSIQVQGPTLQVSAGKTLALYGGNVSVDGGLLQAAGGRVDLGGVAGAQTVGLVVDGNNLGLSYSSLVPRADVSLTNAANVRVAAGGGGSIAINARNIDISGGSNLFAGIGQGLGTPGSTAGNVSLNATEAIAIGQSSNILNRVNLNAIGNSGEIDIQGRSVAITDGAALNANTRAQGNAGSISVQATDTVSLANSFIFSNVGSSQGAPGRGNVGSIRIDARSVSLTDGAQLQAGVYSGGQGNAAGIVSVRGRDSVSFAGNGTGILNNVAPLAIGNGGNIEISGESVSLTDGAIVSAGNAGLGNAGSVSVQAMGEVSLAGSTGIFSSVESGAVGNGGDINIAAGSLSLTNASLLASTDGRGNAGRISVQTSGPVSLANSQFFNSVGSGAEGKGGDIDIIAGALSLRDGASLLASTNGRGDAGRISVQASGPVSLVNSRFFNNVGPQGVGNGGNIDIMAGSLSLTDVADLTTVNFGGQGNAGNISVQTSGPVTLSGTPSSISTAVAFAGVGKGGNIDIVASSLSLSDRSSLFANTQGQGDAGNISVRARDSVSLTNSVAGSTVLNQGVGKGGDISIQTGSLSLTDGTSLASSTEGRGDAGRIFVQASNSVSLANSSSINSSVQAGGIGNANNIDIQTRGISVTNGSQVQASVFAEQGNLPGGRGNGGNIQINAIDSVNISGIDSRGFSSGLLTATETGARGRAGDITVNTGAFRLADGAIVNARTLNPSDGGNITINANALEAVNAGRILANTFDRGMAGSISINAKDSITLSGRSPVNEGSASGLFTNTIESSTGQGGSLRIATDQLIVRNGAQVNVSSRGAGAAGDLVVSGRSILLDNEASLRAETQSGAQGNITLRSGDLLLRRNSNITTNAGGTATGGNITLDTGNLVALENSDITANATNNFGGRVFVNAQGIFGTQFREALTPESDITATSDLGPQFSGIVQINTPDVDPSRGLVALPTQVVDAPRLIAQGCAGGDGATGSQFTATGRGGLPPSPYDPLTSDVVWEDSVDARLPATTAKQHYSVSVTTTPPSTPAAIPIVPATGWMFNDKGKVTLTALAPTATLNIPWLTASTCHAP